MKKTFIIFLIFFFIIPKELHAQKNEDTALAIGAGLLAIGAGIAAVESVKEQMELSATQWLLSNRDDITDFSLKTLSFNGVKWKDMSSVSVIAFKIQEFDTNNMQYKSYTSKSRTGKTKVIKGDLILSGKKHVLFCFTSSGWVNQNGLDVDFLNWFLVDAEAWMKMMVSYVKLSSDQNDENLIKETLVSGRVKSSGIKVKSEYVIPFYKLEGDMYVVTDYSPEMKLVYNEKSMGIYLKETQDLVQMRKKTMGDVHEFFFEK